METIVLIIQLLIGSSVIGLILVGLMYFLADKKIVNPELAELTQIIAKAGWVYLKKQSKLFAFVLLSIMIVLYILYLSGFIATIYTVIYLPIGATLSLVAGFAGFHVATIYNALVAEASRLGLKKAKNKLLYASAMAGLFVHSFALLDIGIAWWVIYYFESAGMLGDSLLMLVLLGFITTTLSLGASLYALFARGGGGIYTKAADVGADFVGKVLLHLEEDSVLNPGTIADNVGDNVGDINGMFADFYETFLAMIVGGTVLFATAFRDATIMGLEDFGGAEKGILFFFSIPIIGLFASMIGLWSSKAHSSQEKQVARSQQLGFMVTSVLLLVSTYVAAIYTVGTQFWYAVLVGLVLANILSFLSEYYTSYVYQPVLKMAKAAASGEASILIRMLQTGFSSSGVTVMFLALGIYFTYKIAPTGFELVFIAISGMAMISPLALLLAYDTEGPIADNAQGMNEMLGAPKEALLVTNVLDSIGNTSAAKLKGFAIGSAVMTALVMISAYVSVVRETLIQKGLDAAQFNISLDNPNVLVGLMIGGSVIYVSNAELIRSVGVAAEAMIKEILKQSKRLFKNGLHVFGERPDYNACVKITTAAAQKGIILPTLLIISAPILAGLLGGPEMMGGELMGAVIVGVLLALFQANAGGGADNSKKYIEAGNLGGKHSDAHKAAVIADTLGDPLKDTSGPAINIMIKLMSMTSIITAPFFVYWYYL